MEVHRYGTRYHNWYIVVDGGKATVIDAGCSREFGRLVIGLGAHGMTLDDVETVLVTHGHADHLGFANEAIDNDLDVRIHADDELRALGRYEGKFAIAPHELPLWKPGVIRFLVALLRKGVMKLPPVQAIGTFSDGDVIDTPGKPRVVHTPGHTEGHSAFYLEETGVLFTGDALALMSLTGGDDGPQLLADAFHNDVAEARRSLDRLAALSTRHVYPGHGDPVAGEIADLVARVE